MYTARAIILLLFPSILYILRSRYDVYYTLKHSYILHFKYLHIHFGFFTLIRYIRFARFLVYIDYKRINGLSGKSNIYVSKCLKYNIDIQTLTK